jgi:hypothetical protein
MLPIVIFIVFIGGLVIGSLIANALGRRRLPSSSRPRTVLDRGSLRTRHESKTSQADASPI